MKLKDKKREEAWAAFAEWEKRCVQQPDDPLRLIGELVDMYIRLHSLPQWNEEWVQGIVEMREMLKHVRKAA